MFFCFHVFSCAFPKTVGAEGRNTAAVGVMEETGQVTTEVTKVDGRARGCTPDDSGEAGTSKTITNPLWHVEAYMKL